MICSNLGPQISKVFLFLSEIFIKSTNFIKIETEKVINNATYIIFQNLPLPTLKSIIQIDIRVVPFVAVE